MNQPKILHIETATNICAVALSEGENLIFEKMSNEDKSHGKLLTVFIEELFTETNIKPSEIDAVSVSKGPGSYTGLRIGVSVAKGFAYGRNIPVIGIHTLKSLAAGALNNKLISKYIEKNPESLLCPMLDARRMEVYYGIYTARLDNIEPISAKIIDENSFTEHLNSQKIVFFGNGSDKTRSILHHSNALFVEGIEATAKNMIKLAVEAWEKKDFEDTAYFEPFYLKDFVATTSKKKVL